MFILLVPVLRSLLSYGEGGKITSFIIIESLLSTVIIVIAIMRWKAYKVCVSDGVMRIYSGFLIKKASVIPVNKICGVYIERIPLLSLTGAVRIRIETEAGAKNKSDFEFFFASKHVVHLTRVINVSKSGVRKYKCTFFQTVLLALSNASALTGLLIAASVSNSAGKLLGKAINEELFETLTIASVLMDKFVPPFFTILTILLISGFAISFLAAFFKNSRFKVKRNGGGISVSQGIIWHRLSCMQTGSIGATIISRPPILRMLKRCSLLISIAGYGKFKGESSVVVPVEKLSDIKQSFALLELPYSTVKYTAKPPARAYARAVFAPILTLIITVGSAVVLTLLFSTISFIIWIIAAFVALITVYYLSVRINYQYNGGMTLRNGIGVSAYRRLSLEEASFDPNKVDCICVTQGPYDRMYGLSTVRVTLRGEQGYSLKCKNIDTKQILDELYDKYNI